MLYLPVKLPTVIPRQNRFMNIWKLQQHIHSLIPSEFFGTAHHLTIFLVNNDKFYDKIKHVVALCGVVQMEVVIKSINIIYFTFVDILFKRLLLV